MFREKDIDLKIFPDYVMLELPHPGSDGPWCTCNVGQRRWPSASQHVNNNEKVCTYMHARHDDRACRERVRRRQQPPYRRYVRARLHKDRSMRASDTYLRLTIHARARARVKRRICHITRN